jgi:tetratricopeptide (TPR) repeat protein
VLGALDVLEAWRLEGELPDLDAYYPPLSRIRDGVELRRRFLDLFDRRYGPDDARTIDAYTALAKHLARADRSDEAEPLAREAVDRVRVAAGVSEAVEARALGALGLALRLGGEAEEALALCDEARPLVERRGAERLDPEDAELWLGRGECLTALGRFDDAERELLSVHELLTGAGATPVIEQMTIRTLVELYEQWHEADPSGGHEQQGACWRERVGLDRESAER